MSKIPHLKDLRTEAAEKGIRVHRQGGQWVSGIYSEGMGLWDEKQEPYWYNDHTERQMLAVKLGYDE